MREILMQTWLFNELTPAECQTLLDESSELRIPPGFTLTEKGWKNDAIRIVIDGEVGLPNSDYRLKEGDMFGEMSWLDGQEASATLVAATEVTLLSIPHAGMDRFLARHPDAHIQVLRKLAINLSHRLRGQK